MNDDEYQATLIKIVDSGSALFNLIHESMQQIHDDAGVNDQWEALYVMSRLSSVVADLARAEQDGK